MTVPVADIHGFWGDDRSAPAGLVAGAENLNYLTIDYLAEVTLAVLARQPAEDPDRGYATDFPDVVSGIIEDSLDRDVTILANAGGVNPESCPDAIVAGIRDVGVGSSRKSRPRSNGWSDSPSQPSPRSTASPPVTARTWPSAATGRWAASAPGWRSPPSGSD
jgi:hypothetical protein